MKNAKFLTIMGVLPLLALGACATKVDKNASAPIVASNNEAQPLEMSAPPPAPITSANVDASASAGMDYATGSNKGFEETASRSRISIIDIGDRVYFETDSYILTAKAREILAKQANFIMSRPNAKVLIAGNCDERGTREYNIALGARRANSARDYLVSLGVNSSQISTVSYGKERPLDARPSNDGWAVNRNAQTKIQ